MSLTKQPMRYAHPEGHTDVCYYTGEKKGLITCGADGDVRSWLNLMDDDPAASCIAEQAIAVVSKNDKIYVGNDNNTVQILTYPDLEKEGIITRFSASVSALATAKDSKFIVSGACDMRIHLTNVDTSDNIEFEGHTAPILGLSLDPKEEFIASSSADGSVRIWNIKDKHAVNIWNNIVPKDNSFFTAKAYCTPSFHPVDGKYLAFPSQKDVVVVERSSWKELYKFKCPSLKAILSICKFSECGTCMAASSVYGEIVVWDVNTKEEIGYIEHPHNTKITSLAWNLDEPNEVAFCDAAGQLGCISVERPQSFTVADKLISKNSAGHELLTTLPSEDEDDENVISLRKIKASVDLEDDQKSITNVSEKSHLDARTVLPEVNLQPPFQSGSSPEHLLSRFMVWNDVGMVRCFTSEDGDESNIQIEFHDASVHHSMYINNYLKHTLAALSTKALALSCPALDDTPSKLVVVSLQGWGSGTKEWTLDLPEGEEGECLAAGNTFVAIVTSKRNLRIYMVGGTQREVIALPGPVVTINGLGNSLVVVYHSGVGVGGDQHMSLLWIRIQGPTIRNETLNVPLSPSSNLMWLGLSDFGSPTTLDADDIVRIYDQRSRLWRVACDLSKKNKGMSDHYFLTGVSEEQRLARGVLCKGSFYPPTTPKPFMTEIPLTVPLCDPESGKTEHERKLWQIGSNPLDENEAVLFLFALACRNNVDYRAVELCEQIASQKVLDLAVQYAQRMNRTALANKLESIAEMKDQQKEVEKSDEENHSNDYAMFDETATEEVEPLFIPPTANKKKSDIEIRPLSMNESLSLKKMNPFIKSTSSNSTKGLTGLDVVPEKPQKVLTPLKPTSFKSKQKPASSKKDTFVSWYSKNKKSLQEEFPHLNSSELGKLALSRFDEENKNQNSENDAESKKRKLSSQDDELNSQPKRSSTILDSFRFKK